MPAHAAGGDECRVPERRVSGRPEYAQANRRRCGERREHDSCG
jgi:hypothetical protein